MNTVDITQRKLELIEAIHNAYRVLSHCGEYWEATNTDVYKAIESVSKSYSIGYAFKLADFELEEILESAQQLLQAHELLFNQPKRFRFFYVDNGDYDYTSDDFPKFENVLKWTLIPYSEELCEKWINCKDHKNILSSMYAVNEDGSNQDFQYFSSEADARLAIYFERCQAHYEYIHDI